MYDFVKTSEIEIKTTKVAAEFQKLCDTPSLDPTALPDSINGIPMHPEAKVFAERMAREFRGCTFGVTNHCKKTYYQGRYVYNELWLMMPGQAFALGRIGYADYTNHSTGAYSYSVYSRTINNEKYRDGSDNFYRAMSSDIERAVKNAKKHLRMYSPVEFAQMTAREFTCDIEDGTHKVQSAYNKARHEVQASADLYREIKHLMESGYKFLSAEFTTLAASWMDTFKAWLDEQARIIPACFVHVSVVRDEQTFEVVEIEDAKGKLGNYAQVWADTKPKRYKSEDLPEDIMGKLSVLSLLEVGQYTGGVGKRVGETMFWVERTND